MPDTADILKERFTLIGEAVSPVSDKLLWRWGKYHHGEGLKVGGYHDGGQFIDFRRWKDGKAAAWATNVRPVDDIKGQGRIKGRTQRRSIYPVGGGEHIPQRCEADGGYRKADSRWTATQ